MGGILGSVHTGTDEFGTVLKLILVLLVFTWDQGLNFIVAIAVEGEQNAVDHCGNDGNFLPHSVIFILFTVHYYFDT
jgi:hypothetical protein